MRPPRSISCVALVLILAQTTGCVSFRPSSPDLLTTEPPGLKVGARYRFTLRDGHQETLYFHRADSLMIVGKPRKNSWEVRSLERAEIRGIEEQFKTASEGRIALVVVSATVCTWLLWEAVKHGAHSTRCDLFPNGKGC